MSALSLPDLGNTGALFALILVAGFIAGKTGFLSKESQIGMTNLVLYITLPCTIFNSFKVDYEPSLLRGFVFTLLLAACAQAIGQIASLVFFRKQPHEKRTILRYGLIVCNSGFFGISVLFAVLGNPALSFGAIYLIPQRFAMWILGIPVFTDDKTNPGSVALKTLVHPSMIACYIGLTLMFTRTSVPAAIAAPLSVLGLCTMPLSMLLVGSVMVEIKPSLFLDRQVYFYCLIRLVMIPGLIFLICLLLGLGGDILHVSVLMAGMPSAMTASLLALRYGADERFSSALIVVSTIMFFVMLPVWMSLFLLVP